MESKMVMKQILIPVDDVALFLTAIAMTKSKMVMKKMLIPVDDVEVVVVIGLLEQNQDFGQLSLEWEEWEPLLGLGLEQEILELGAVRQVPELGQMERGQEAQVRAHG